MKFPSFCSGSSLCGQMIKAAWHQMSPGDLPGVEQFPLMGELNAAAECQQEATVLGFSLKVGIIPCCTPTHVPWLLTMVPSATRSGSSLALLAFSKQSASGP